MNYIMEYINNHRLEILNEENIESYAWKYILKHKIFTENHIVIDYLKEKFGIHPQLVYRYENNIKKFRNIKKELRLKFKSVLNELETVKLINRTTYTDKIFIVE